LYQDRFHPIFLFLLALFSFAGAAVFNHFAASFTASIFVVFWVNPSISFLEDKLFGISGTGSYKKGAPVVLLTELKH